MPQFTARLIVSEGPGVTEDSQIDMEWDEGPMTYPLLIPAALFPRKFPQSEIADPPTVTDYWDFQYVSGDGIPVYKYRTAVG